MGNIDSQEVTPEALESSRAEDAELIMFAQEPSCLFDQQLCIELYKERLSRRPAANSFKKINKECDRRRRTWEKSHDAEVAAGIVPEDEILSSKRIKWLHKKLSWLVQAADANTLGYWGLLQRRIQHLEQVHGALVRQQLRDEMYNKSTNSSTTPVEISLGTLSELFGSNPDPSDAALFELLKSRLDELPTVRLGHVSTGREPTTTQDTSSASATGNTRSAEQLAEEQETDSMASMERDTADIELSQPTSLADSLAASQSQLSDDTPTPVHSVPAQPAVPDLIDISEGLLSAILEHVLVEALEMLRKLEVPEVTKSPGLKLLSVLQVGFLVRAASTHAPLIPPQAPTEQEAYSEKLKLDEQNTKNLFQFAHQVFKCSSRILQQAIAVNSRLNQEHQLSNKSVQLAPFLDPRIESVLEHTLVGYVTLPLLVSLCAMPVRARFFSHCEAIFDAVEQLVINVDSLACLSSDVHKVTETVDQTSAVAVEGNTERLLSGGKLVVVIVESPHNYHNNMQEEKIVSIPGASHLCLTFDERCHTEKGKDTLQVFRMVRVPGHTDVKKEAATPVLHGDPSCWPKSTILVAGDSLVFRFMSDAFNNFWGYRCVVTGINITYPGTKWSADACPRLPVLFELQRTLARYAAVCAKTLVVGGTVAEEEKQLVAVLDSPLFVGGIEDLTSLDTMEDISNQNPVQPPASVEPDVIMADLSQSGVEIRPFRADLKVESDAQYCAFIDDFISARPDSLAKHLISFLDKQLPGTPMDRLGGELVSEAVRAYVASLIHHLGLVPLAIDAAHIVTRETVEDISNTALQHLIDMWGMGKKFRQWIISDRQRLLNEKEEMLSRKTQDGTQSMDVDIEPSMDETSYEYICNTIIRKVRFLLSVSPCTTPVLPPSPGSVQPLNLQRAISDSSVYAKTKILTLARQASEEGEGDGGNLERWKSRFNMWKEIQHYSVVKRRRKEYHSHHQQQALQNEELVDSIPDLVTSFIQTTAQLDKLHSLLRTRVDRAKSRIDGLESIHRLLTTVKDPSTKKELIRVLGSAFKSEGSASSLGHYLNHVRACGLRLEGQIKESFGKLYAHLASLIRNANTDMATKSLIIDALSLDYRQEDHPLILRLQIFPCLRDLVFSSEFEATRLKRNTSTSSNSSSSSNQNPSHTLLLQRQIAFLSMQLLALIVFQDARQSSVPEANFYSAGDLERLILDVLTSELHRGLLTLSLLLSAEHTDTQVYKQQESLTYSLFALFSLITTSPHFDSYICSHNVTTLLWTLSTRGSPRIQRLALRHLRRALALLDPASLGDVVSSFDASAAITDGSSLTSALLQMTGRLLQIDQPAFDFAVPHNENDYRTGSVHFAIASELVMLLRHLLRDKKWRPAVLHTVHNALLQIPSMIDTTVCCVVPSASGTLLDMAVAALAVIGGHNELMRVGCRVETQSKEGQSETGVVVGCDRESNFVKVIFKSTPTKAIEVEPDKLRPLSEIDLDPSCFAMDSSLLRSLLAVGMTSNIEDIQTRAAKREEKKREEAAQRERQKQEKHERRKSGSRGGAGMSSPDHSSPSNMDLEEEWACGICTLINPPGLTICVACESTRPMSSRPQSSTPQRASPPTSPQTGKGNMGGDDAVTSAEFEVVVVDEEDEIRRLSFTHLKSRSLKAVCMLLKHTPSIVSLFEHGLIPSLLLLAVQPASLDEFRSLERIEQQEQRLWEILKDKQYGVEQARSRLVRTVSESQADMLEHSPFRYMPVHLPSSLERSTSRRLLFTGADRRAVERSRRAEQDGLMASISTVSVSATNTSNTNVSNEEITAATLAMANLAADDFLEGVARANFAIPNSLPAFYFEVEVVSLGRGGSQDMQVEDNKQPQFSRISLGLFRDGVTLEDPPGCHNSYAWASTGEIFHSSDTVPECQNFASPFQQGDVVGCGWDIKRRYIYFTKNGEMVGTAFKGVSGRFRPCVWLEGVGSKLHVNFGQTPFRFAFESTLPPEYVEEITSPHKGPGHAHMSESEMRRRTQAEDLNLMMGGGLFPLELCIMALERNADEMEVAANWLLEHGFRELERMQTTMIERTEREERERIERAERALLASAGVALGSGHSSVTSSEAQEWHMHDIAASHHVEEADEDEEDEDDERHGAHDADMEDEEDEDGGEEVARSDEEEEEEEDEEVSDDESSARRRLDSFNVFSGGQHNMSMDEEDENDGDEETDGWFDDEEFRQHTQRGAGNNILARYLDDEMDADVPIGVIQRRETRNQEQVKIEDLLPGMPLRIVENADTILLSSWSTRNDWMKGRVGIVHGVDINSQKVQLALFDTDLAVQVVVSVDIQVLQKPTKRWVDPCADVFKQSFDVSAIRKALVQTEMAWSVLKVRRAVLAILSDWPAGIPFSLANLGGAQCMIDLLKLACAELGSALGRSSNGNLADSESDGKSQHPLLVAFRERLSEMLNREKEGGVSASSPTSASDLLLSRLLARECTTHFRQAAQFPAPVLIEESEHPYANNLDYRSKIHIPGAQRLLVQFDARSALIHDTMTAVSLYADEQYDDLISRFGGRGGNAASFQSVIVNGDKCWFRFTSSMNNDKWGYKMVVTPVEFRLSDEQALDGVNFEFGAWLLDLLLEQGSDSLKEEYLGEVALALLQVASSRSSSKPRSVGLLIRVLQEMQNYPNCIHVVKQLPWNKLKTLRKKMEMLCERENLDRRQQVHSPQLQMLVELMVTAHLMANQVGIDWMKSRKLSAEEPDSGMALRAQNSLQLKGKDKHETINIQDLGSLRLEIIRAYYGVMDDVTLKKDVTADLIQHLNRCGGCILPVPAQVESILSQGNIPNTSKPKHLRVIYRIVWADTGIILSRGEKQWASGDSAVVIRAEGSWFDRIVELADISRSVTQANCQPPRHLLHEALKLDLWSRSFMPLVPSSVSLDANKTAKVLPDIGSAVGTNFSLTTWIYWTPPDEASGAAAEEQVDNDSSSRRKWRSIVYKGRTESGNGNSGRPRFPQLSVHSSDRKVMAAITTMAGGVEEVVSEGTVPPRRWTHLAVICDGRTLKLAIDGNIDSTRTIQGRPKPNTEPFFIGKVPSGIESAARETLGMEGLVADCRMYPRALENDEIYTVIQSSAPKDRERKEVEWIPSAQHNLAMRLDKTAVGTMLQERRVNSWNASMDQALVEMLQQVCEEKKQNILDIPLASIRVDAILLRRFPILTDVPVDVLRFRLAVIRALNLKIAAVLSMVDFAHVERKWSLAHRLSCLRGVIFLELKNRLWDQVINASTGADGRIRITINRPRATRAREKGDPEAKKSVFGQMYRQLHFVAPSRLRQRDRPFSVVYEGEGGTDAGGLFRDSISHLCSDLQSAHVLLFIPCPNSRGFGDNQEKFIPNPSATSSLQLSMYSFVGKMMGVAIRLKHFLNLDLPSIVWKPLVGQSVERSDLETVDSLCYQILDKVLNIEKEGVTRETFQDYIPYTFTITSSDGRELELKEGGRELPVTWENRQEFVRLVEHYRLKEFDLQVRALRRGLATIVPVQLLQLFTWEELERKVCGKRDVDVEFLRENSKYSNGYAESDHHIHMFWDVLKTFSSREKELFLRFVWGRSRLPIDASDFSQKFEIIRAARDHETALPTSHTCFFQLELPRYSTFEVMKQKLLYAITECYSIDTDHAAENMAWNDDD